MVTKVASCTYLGGFCYPFFSTQQVPSYGNDRYPVHCGYYHSNHYMSILEFITPTVKGVPLSIKFTLRAGFSNNTGSIRYALCTSDTNYESYYRTFGVVDDTNQIASGVFETEVNSNPIEYTINIDEIKLRPDTVYYLFLWAGEEGYSSGHLSFDRYQPAIIEVGYLQGSVNIDNGSELKKCLCYIDNGESLVLAIPHIDTGTEWKVCS